MLRLLDARDSKGLSTESLLPGVWLPAKAVAATDGARQETNGTLVSSSDICHQTARKRHHHHRSAYECSRSSEQLCKSNENTAPKRGYLAGTMDSALGTESSCALRYEPSEPQDVCSSRGTALSSTTVLPVRGSSLGGMRLTQSGGGFLMARARSLHCPGSERAFGSRSACCCAPRPACRWIGKD